MIIRKHTNSKKLSGKKLQPVMLCAYIEIPPYVCV